MLGWVHSDHLLHEAKPNLPENMMKAPDRDYGKQALPANCSAGPLA